MYTLIQSSLRHWWRWFSLVLLAVLILNGSVADAQALLRVVPDGEGSLAAAASSVLNQIVHAQQSNQPQSYPSSGQIGIFPSARQPKGKLEIIKILIPNNDPGKFNLQIDGVIHAPDIGNSGSTGEQELSPGIHTVAETAGTDTDLADYTSQIECRRDNGQGAVVASSNNAGPLDVSISDGDDIVCIITNTGQMANLEVIKILSPDNDPGRFNLQIDDVIYAINVGHGGSTGELIVPPGVRTVAETAATGTDLANYASSIECRADNGAGDLVASSSNAGPLDVPLEEGDDIVCAITNIRQMGKLEVIKILSPENDTGKFNLQIDGVMQAAEVGNGGSTGERIVPTGSHTVSETANPGTDLTDYTSQIECRNQNGTGNIVASDSGASFLNVPVGLNDDIICIITNTRAPRGSITIIKEAMPESSQVFNFTSTIPGASSFTLMDDGANPAQKTIAFSDLRSGSYTIREIVPKGWVLMSISCSNGHSVSLPQATKITVNLQPGEALTCTFTNDKPAVEASEPYRLFLPLIVN